MRKILLILSLLMTVLDAAAFEVRAVYVDHRTQVMTLPALKALARKAADGGMNALVMEWEATFPFDGNATLCNRFAFSKAEAEEFISYCSGIGIDVIPLQNCFGHSEYILRHERYSALREDSKDLSQVCPLKREKAKEVFGSIFAEIAALHPSEYIHIGCDETRLLGHCKECARFVRENGKSKLFVDYVSLMCDIVKKLGKTPVIWADILLQYPDAASELPDDIVVVDWNYGWNVNHFGSIDNLLSKGITMWGASSLRSSPDNIYLTDWPKHFGNLRNYIPFCREKAFSGIIQTSWSTSGQYGYVWDHNSVVDIQPIREVYPSVAFDILWQAFFAAVSDNGLREDFIPSYLQDHFGLAEEDAMAFARYFDMPQKVVTGKGFNAGNIMQELQNAKQMRQVLKEIKVRRNKQDFGHLALMLDIRINYLNYKKTELEFESSNFASGDRKRLAGELKPLLKDAESLRKRFAKLNRGFLKDASIPLGDASYIGKMNKLYEICR